MPARRRLTPREFYRILHRIADRKIGAAEEEFLRAIRATLDGIDAARLERALESIYARLEAQRQLGQRLSVPAEAIDDVVNALSADGILRAQVESRFAPLLRNIVIESGVATAALSPPRVTIRFDVTNPRATLFARRESSRFVRDLTEATRKTVRREIARGFRDGRTVRDTARVLRGTVGLSDQQAKWVGNFRRDWLVDMNARVAEGRPLLAKYKKRLRQLQSRFPTTKKPFTEAEMQGLVGKYQARLLRQRATEVARTETIRASAGGQVEAWQQMADKGLIDLRVFRVGWSFTKDALTSCSCRSIPRLNPKGVKLGEPFRMEDCRTGAIVLVYLPGDPHPFCRCALVAIFHTDEADVGLEEVA